MYRALRKLDEEGFTASSWAQSAAGPRRRHYELTAKGRRELAQLAEAITVKRNVHSAFLMVHEADAGRCRSDVSWAMASNAGRSPLPGTASRSAHVVARRRRGARRRVARRVRRRPATGRRSSCLWLAGWRLLAAAFAMRERAARRASRSPTCSRPAGSSSSFAPLYLLRAHRRPVQVGSDEIAIMSSARELRGAAGVDLVRRQRLPRPSAGLLVVFGKIGELLGGVELLHMRLLHGVARPR